MAGFPRADGSTSEEKAVVRGRKHRYKATKPLWDSFYVKGKEGKCWRGRQGPGISSGGRAGHRPGRAAGVSLGSGEGSGSAGGFLGPPCASLCAD